MLPPPGFDWDPSMSARCEAEYGFSFSDLVNVFEDAEIDYLRLGPFDLHGEQRYLAIGRMEWGTIVAVVYTMRAGVRRLIWVRPARRSERAELLAYNAGIHGEDER
ncbi:MAG TPA: BrnT family toxin [Longimicrobiaceae bacterium]|nr:BrnT family toxin [Longimicrobiaceae bacterium]